MTYDNLFSYRIFSRGHKALTQWTFIFGGILFLLAILIFTYPVLIAYLFSGVILLAGIFVLILACKLWRVRENISRFEQEQRKAPIPLNRETIYFRWHR
jgi:hypothetical protein